MINAYMPLCVFYSSSLTLSASLLRDHWMRNAPPLQQTRTSLKMFHAHFFIKPSNTIANDMIEDAPPPA